MSDILDLTLCEAAAEVARGAVIAHEITELALARIAADPAAAACFNRLDADGARAAIASLPSTHTSAPFAGLALAHKDIFALHGATVTLGAHPAFHLRTQATAPAVARLAQAGAINLGGLHLSEFAMGPAGFSSQYGLLENPLDPARVTGGSSSGSAAAVARGLAYGALGTDTGGSIRIPAAFCGVVGLKPSSALVPVTGVFPVSEAMDTVGPLARSVADCARLLDVLTQSTRYERAARDGTPVRFGFVRPDNLPATPDDVIADGFADARVALARAGHTVRDVAVDNLAELAALGGMVFLSEAGETHGTRLREQLDLIGPQVSERLLAGLTIPASLYLRALRSRASHRARLAATLADVEVLVMPTAPALPPLRAIYDGKDTGEILALNGRLGAYTGAFSYLGVPAMSVPAPARSGSLPIGLQVIANHGEDDIVLRAGALIERCVRP